MVELLPVMREALGLIPNPIRRKKRERLQFARKYMGNEKMKTARVEYLIQEAIVNYRKNVHFIYCVLSYLK